MLEFKKKSRHEPTEPQLATMIDVFSILIIFLIASSSFEKLSVDIPSHLTLPTLIGSNTENGLTTSGHSVLLNKNELIFPWLEGEAKISLPIERDLEKEKSNADIIQQKIGNYQTGGALSFNIDKNDLIYKQINLVASKDVLYQDLFVAISQLRKIGFRNINMVGTLSSQSL